MCAVPLVFQSSEEWQSSELGLHPIQVALQVFLLEIDGAIEPIIFAGRKGDTGRSIRLADRVNLLADKALKWSKLKTKPAADKKIAITIFSFSPDKGNVGTAVYLDVFDSVKAVLEELKAKGYDIGDAPSEKEEIMESVLNVYGKQFGNVFIGVQPSFGYEGDPMRLLFAKSASPHHGVLPITPS